MERGLEGILELQKTGTVFPKVSFNVSFQRLTEPGLVQSLCNVHQMTSRSAFELVESVSFDNLSDEEIDVVNALRDLGIGIEIDDFGTGHASIIALPRLKPDLLKIDRALISPLSHHPGQVKLLSAIVDMAQGLGIKVLAEGVETEEEINKLRMIGVDYAQGFAFSKPLPLDELRGFLMQKTA